MRTIYFYFDDSGVLHKNSSSNYFIYAGFVFCDKNELESARRKYINANKKLKKTLHRNDELKACSLSNKHKRALFNAVKEYETVSVVVKIDKLYNYILEDKKSICRFKDYAIKRCIKSKLKSLISKGIIQENEDVSIRISIDEQLTANNSYYTLVDSIKEELMHGIIGHDYGVFHQPVFSGNVDVVIQYCDSKTNYLIQASDILANRIFNSYTKENPELRQINNHFSLTLP